MFTDSMLAEARNVRIDLMAMFQPIIDDNLSALKIDLDWEIEQEIRERVAVLTFDELVNEMPVVPYLAVWEEGAVDIVHVYMSPRIESICDFTPYELQRIGYANIVRGDIISFYRDDKQVEETVDPINDAKQKRVAGFLESRNWEGVYRIEKKDGRMVWVIDRSTITRFRNTVANSIVCLSSGILIKTTELLERRETKRAE